MPQHAQQDERSDTRHRQPHRAIFKKRHGLSDGVVQTCQERGVDVARERYGGRVCVPGERSCVVVPVERERDAARAEVLHCLLGQRVTRVRVERGRRGGGIGGDGAVGGDGGDERGDGAVVGDDVEGRVLRAGGEGRLRERASRA